MDFSELLVRVDNQKQPFMVQDWPDEVCSSQELATRFKVSKKTILRWRDKGLIGWRFLHPDKNIRISFSKQCVNKFIADNPAIVHNRKIFSRIGEDERQSIIERIKDLIDSNESLTINAVGKKIHVEFNRATESVRLLIQKYDDEHPYSGFLNRPKDSAIWDLYIGGESVSELSCKFNQPESAIFDSLKRGQIQSRLPGKISFIDSSQFHTNNPEWILESKGNEFRRMNYLKFKAEQLRERITTIDEVDQVENLLSEADHIKCDIAESNLSLVKFTLSRTKIPDEEAISDGYMVLLHAVEKFDYMRGFQFSTYVFDAIMRRYYTDHKPRKIKHFTNSSTINEIVYDDGTENFEQQAEICHQVHFAMKCLGGRERYVLESHFGMVDGIPQSLAQIGVKLGVCKERVRQIKAIAIEKCRGEFE